MIHKRIVVLNCIMILLVLVGVLCGCDTMVAGSSYRDEVIERFRERLAETAPITSDTVYWTGGGSVYHLDPNCRFLSDSSEVLHGSVAQSGRSKLCSTCASNSGNTENDPNEDSLSFESNAVDSVINETQDIIETLEISGEITSDNPKAEDTSDNNYQSLFETTSIEIIPVIPITSIDNDTSSNEKNISKTDDTLIHSETMKVYWTPNGSVWHLDRNCSALAKSKVINEGTVEESGKERGCKKCSGE